MRFAIVDDLGTERTLLKERLARQLRQRGTEAELLEFDSGEAFLVAEEAQRFTAAFLDIYMDGLSGMDAAKELRKTDADCLLVFTTTSTDHALEGFQVRAFHYLVKPFSEAELSGLLDEMLAKLPRPEPVLTVKVDGSDIHLRYRDIISAEHFAHIINIRTTAGKTLAMRQSFKAFTEPLKKDPRFFVCGRGTIINMENAADFQDAAFCMTDGSQVYVSQELLKAARQAFMNFCCKGGVWVEGCSAPDPGAYRCVSRPAARVFSGALLSEAVFRKACGMGGAAAVRALPWRRAVLLSFRSLDRVPLAAHNDCDNFPVSQNAAALSLEIRDHRAGGLRGICVPE